MKVSNWLVVRLVMVVFLFQFYVDISSIACLATKSDRRLSIEQNQQHQNILPVLVFLVDCIYNLTNYVQMPYNQDMTETINKASRFEMRLTPSQKERLDQAAETKGLSTSQWALSNLLVAADRDIQESHTLYLDDEQWNSFIKALDEPMPAKMVELLESEPIWK